MTEKSKKLAQYINGLNGFTMVNSIDGNYENMGLPSLMDFAARN